MASLKLSRFLLLAQILWFIDSFNPFLFLFKSGSCHPCFDFADCGELSCPPFCFVEFARSFQNKALSWSSFFFFFSVQLWFQWALFDGMLVCEGLWQFKGSGCYKEAGENTTSEGSSFFATLGKLFIHRNGSCSVPSFRVNKMGKLVVGGYEVSAETFNRTLDCQFFINKHGHGKFGFNGQVLFPSFRLACSFLTCLLL